MSRGRQQADFSVQQDDPSNTESGKQDLSYPEAYTHPSDKKPQYFRLKRSSAPPASIVKITHVVCLLFTNQAEGPLTQPTQPLVNQSLSLGPDFLSLLWPLSPQGRPQNKRSAGVDALDFPPACRSPHSESHPPSLWRSTAAGVNKSKRQNIQRCT